MTMRHADDIALLTTQEMAEADRLAAVSGCDIDALMHAAGAAVASALAARFPRGRILVLCGPGNNGGDGYVAARLLAARGRDVRVAALGAMTDPHGAAARAAAAWGGAVSAIAPSCMEGADIVVDALFGAGLRRDLDGVARATIEALAARAVPVVAVDVPSGLDGDSGAVRGCVAPATLTVTFFRLKPGHLLLPGRQLCGETIRAQIGLPERVLATIAPRCWHNAPPLWRDNLAPPHAEAHKFARGHALVVGGPILTGAARLAAQAALRAGAGLTTIACAAEAAAIHRASCDPAVMVEALPADGSIAGALADPRRNVVLLGPGNGADATTRDRVVAALRDGRPCVLDADALTAFSGAAVTLCAEIRGPVVMTPHAGEFARLFAAGADKLDATRRAAMSSGAVVLLKGADTVIAAPDGRAAINANAPPDLATAGSGDVLAGTIAGFLAQGMPAFEAACAGAWLHGEAGRALGPGLVASDLAGRFAAVLARLREGS
jgi:NAD(P)H-hydrate epimerase